jgi:hypothetical protein
MIRVDSREISSGDLSQWDELVAQSPHGTIFHKTAWLNACADYYGKTLKIFGCFRDDVLVGGCSLLIGKKWGFVSFAESNSGFTPYGGFVISSLPTSSIHKQETYSRHIIESLTDCIKKEHYISIVVWNSPEFHDIRPFIARGWRSHLQYTYDFDLGVNIESHIDTRLKKTMRRAEKEQFIFEPSSDISKFYSQLCETYARKNLKPAASKRFITDVCLFLRDQNCGEMVVAKTPGDEIACAEIVVWDTKKAYRWAAASDARFLDSGAPSLLLFTILKRMQERSVPKINLMGANTPQLSRFISRFNPTLVPYYQIKSGIFDHILSFKN